MQGDPQATPGHRHRDPLAVRRPRLRHLAPVRGRRRLRLPPEGPICRGRPSSPAIREVATGGSMLDLAIVSALVRPVQATGGLSADDDALLAMVAEGKPIKAIAASRRTTPSAVADEVERLFRSWPTASPTETIRPCPPPPPARGHRRAGGAGQTLSRLPAGRRGRAAGQRRRRHRRHRAARGHGAHVRHPRLLHDRRAHRSRRPGPAAQSPSGRDEPGHPQRDRHGDAVRGRCGHGRAGAPGPRTTPTVAWRRRWPCTPRSRRSTTSGRLAGLPPFGLGIGLSTGEVAAGSGPRSASSTRSSETP